MNEATIDRLEFDAILDRLEAFCGSPGGRALVGEIVIETDPEPIRRVLAETTEARRFIERTAPSWGFGSLLDTAAAIEQVVAGAVLEPLELHAVRLLLEFSEDVQSSSPNSDIYPSIAAMTRGLFTSPEIVKAVARSVDETGAVLDSASAELARSRRRLRRLEQDIPATLRTFVNSTDNSELVQERIVTVRNGRFVVPIRAGKGRSGSYVLQDRSASGSTFFVEPVGVVALNNELVEERITERNEVLNVLRKLSEMVKLCAAELAELDAALSRLDLLMARGRLSIDMRGSEPQITTGDQIKIAAGRHPLLSGNSVPIDISLGGDTRALILTGPNAGGKTVALKMVGLFQLMAQAGLHVPALDGTVLPIFSGIYAVIGDEQSIERSLSTFTSHLSDIAEIVLRAGKRCLVLIDEICSGTDPAEGTALACSVIKKLMDSGAVCMVTSHHGGLKTFASVTPGARNARVLFDETKGEPRFSVEIGLAGKSHALEIAARAGIPRAVVDGARNYLDAQTIMAEKMLTELEHLKGALAVERAALQEEKQTIEESRRLAEQQLTAAEIQRRATLEKAVTEADRLVEQVRDKCRRLLDKAHTAAALPEKAAVKGEIEKTREQVRQIYTRVASRRGKTVTEKDLKSDAVLILRDSGQQVQYVSGPDRKGRVKVLIGDITMTTELRNLGAPDGPLKPQPVRRKATDHEKYLDNAKDKARENIDLRGMRAAEALEVLEQEIMTLNLAGRAQANVIHGIGTGALIKAVQEYLPTNPFVRRFEPAPLNQGGIGCTIIFLKD